MFRQIMSLCPKEKRHLSYIMAPNIRLCRSFATKLPEIIEKDDQSGVSVTFPGFGFEDLDRFGNVKVDRLAKLCEATRMSSFAPSFCGVPMPTGPSYRQTLSKITHDRLIFAMTGNYDILPGFYNREHLYNPIVFTDRIVNIGKTSFQHMHTSKSLMTGELLHESTLNVVVINKKTRRPQEVPEYVREHYKDIDTNVQSERLNVVDMPEDVHKLNYTIRWSDADYYMHTNQACYVRICYDSLVEACLDGAFPGISGDLGKYCITNYTNVYASESEPGDVLEVVSWQSKNNPNKLYASALKEGKLVFQASFTVAPPTYTFKNM